jgi:predicted nucleic acid-binding protein
LDTNILVSALLVETGAVGSIYLALTKGTFTALVSEEQFRELRRTLANMGVRGLFRPVPSQR